MNSMEREHQLLIVLQEKSLQHPEGLTTIEVFAAYRWECGERSIRRDLDEMASPMIQGVMKKSIGRYVDKSNGKYHVVDLRFDPENHHNAALCPYCTPV